jgi:hypothetical protein
MAKPPSGFVAGQQSEGTVGYANGPHSKLCRADHRARLLSGKFVSVYVRR